MTWIENHWEAHYIKKAEKIILEVVCMEFHELRCILTHSNNQMKECGGSDVDAPARPSAAQTAAKKAIPKFASLPTQFNLPDFSIYPQAASSNSTLRGEYDRYRKGNASPEDTDLVEYWSVRRFIRSSEC
jgi:hypothetical protein